MDITTFPLFRLFESALDNENGWMFRLRGQNPADSSPVVQINTKQPCPTGETYPNGLVFMGGVINSCGPDQYQATLPRQAQPQKASPTLTGAESRRFESFKHKTCEKVRQKP